MSNKGLNAHVNSGSQNQLVYQINPCPAELRLTLTLQTAWFAIKYVNLYQLSGSSNLIG